MAKRFARSEHECSLSPHPVQVSSQRERHSRSWVLSARIRPCGECCRMSCRIAAIFPWWSTGQAMSALSPRFCSVQPPEQTKPRCRLPRNWRVSPWSGSPSIRSPHLPGPRRHHAVRCCKSPSPWKKSTPRSAGPVHAEFSVPMVLHQRRGMRDKTFDFQRGKVLNMRVAPPRHHGNDCLVAWSPRCARKKSRPKRTAFFSRTAANTG